MATSRYQAKVRSWALSWFPAFTSHDFRWLWTANIVGSFGMTMIMLAEGWLVLTITDSAFWVGVTAGLRGTGLVGFGALGGVIVDRFGSRRTLAVAQVLRAAIILVIGLLTLTGEITLAAILASALALGAMQGVFLPANNSLAYQAAGPARLLNAMAARLTAFNITRIIGSAVAGFLIEGAGIGWCYLAVSVAFVLSPLPLVRMRGPFITLAERQPLWDTLRDGIQYALRNQAIGTLLLLSLLMECFGFSFLVMLPVMARDVLDLGGTEYGLLSSAWGVGALVATLTVARLGDFREMGKLMVITAGIAGLSIFLFALSPWYPLSLALAGLVGAGLMSYDASMASLLQLLSTDAMRGRVMGLYGLTFGFTPLGGFIEGTVAAILNPPVAVGAGGLIILAWVARTQGFIRRAGKRDDRTSQELSPDHRPSAGWAEGDEHDRPSQPRGGAYSPEE